MELCYESIFMGCIKMMYNTNRLLWSVSRSELFPILSLIYPSSHLWTRHSVRVSQSYIKFIVSSLNFSPFQMYSSSVSSPGNSTIINPEIQARNQALLLALPSLSTYFRPVDSASQEQSSLPFNHLQAISLVQKAKITYDKNDAFREMEK